MGNNDLTKDSHRLNLDFVKVEKISDNEVLKCVSEDVEKSIESLGESERDFDRYYRQIEKIQKDIFDTDPDFSLSEDEKKNLTKKFRSKLCADAVKMVSAHPEEFSGHFERIRSYLDDDSINTLVPHLETIVTRMIDDLDHSETLDKFKQNIGDYYSQIEKIEKILVHISPYGGGTEVLRNEFRRKLCANALEVASARPEEVFGHFERIRGYLNDDRANALTADIEKSLHAHAREQMESSPWKAMSFLAPLMTRSDEAAAALLALIGKLDESDAVVPAAYMPMTKRLASACPSIEASWLRQYSAARRI